MAKLPSKINKKALRERRTRKNFRGISVSTFKDFDEDDVVESDSSKGITSALWSDNNSTITTFYTSSAQTASAAGPYQWSIYREDTATVTDTPAQFSVGYGHYAGSSSVTQSGASDQGHTPSKAIYTAFSNQLLAAGDDKFTVDSVDQDYGWFIAVNRDRYKEKMNPNGWELHLETGTKDLHVIDDSRYNSEGSSNGNRVYNVISGSLAAGQVGTEKLGFFYPDMGLIFLGGKAVNDLTDVALSSGWNNNCSAGGAYVDQNKAMLTALNGAGGKYFAGRAEEDISSTHYFIRVKNSEYNFSNNPTFSTTTGTLQNATMVGDPKVFITTVGLYNDENELVATAKLSKPLLKSFAREATIRVKLDY